MLKPLAIAVLAIVCTPLVQAQKLYTAVRKANIQAGVAGSAFTLDYGEGYEKGFTIYGDIDFARHIGIEALYRNASIVTPYDIGENHILAGPRLSLTRRRFTPYLKGLGGVGTINFQQGFNVSAHSDSYFIFALGGGVDFSATRHINIRLIDFEYQIWPTFQPNGLTPTGFSAGAAYRF